MRLRLLVVFLLVGVCPLRAQDPVWVRDWEAAQRERPAHLTSQSRITPGNEPGEPLVVQGRVFLPDGVTPAVGVVVFAYHTDAKGLYHPAGKAGWRLRGWAVTDKEGAFAFRTIRPASYPGRTVPAHIHCTVSGGQVARQWTEELRFDDDPLVSAEERERSRAEGKFGNVRPVQRQGKTQQVDFNIRAKAQKEF